MRTEDVPPTVQKNDGTEMPGKPAALLQARRKFIKGSVGVSAFAATLVNRPAFAGDGWCSYVVQEVCSVHHSNTLHISGCSGSHSDHFSSNKNNWGGCKTTYTIPTCNGNTWTPTTAVCGFSNVSLWSLISPCYKKTGSGSNAAYTQSETGCTQGQINGHWFAIGFLNAYCNPGSFGYSCADFGKACAAAFSVPSCDHPTIAAQLCSFIKSNCPAPKIVPIKYANYHTNWCFT